MNCYLEKFATFNASQFAENEYFRQWVLASDEENYRFWQSFLAEYPHKKAEMDEARRHIENQVLFPTSQLTVSEKDSLKNAIFQELYTPSLERPIPLIKRISRSWIVAASICSIVIISLTWFLNRKPSDIHVELAKHVTDMRQVKEIMLPDSSVVILNGNSTITFNPAMNAMPNREIHLTGNAYFKIKKNSAKPFIVHADRIDIQVTGTEFNVDTRTAATGVVLTNGSVNISSAQNSLKQQKTNLKAGEKFRLDTLSHSYKIEEIDTELYTAAWDKGEWHFESTTLEQIASLIQQFYGTPVIFKNTNKQKLKIDAVISVKNLSTLIQVIERTLNISITEKGNEIIIN